MDLNTVFKYQVYLSSLYIILIFIVSYSLLVLSCLMTRSKVNARATFSDMTRCYISHWMHCPHLYNDHPSLVPQGHAPGTPQDVNTIQLHNYFTPSKLSHIDVFPSIVFCDLCQTYMKNNSYYADFR